MRGTSWGIPDRRGGGLLHHGLTLGTGSLWGKEPVKATGRAATWGELYFKHTPWNCLEKREHGQGGAGKVFGGPSAWSSKEKVRVGTAAVTVALRRCREIWETIGNGLSPH